MIEYVGSVYHLLLQDWLEESLSCIRSEPYPWYRYFMIIRLVITDKLANVWYNNLELSEISYFFNGDVAANH